MTSTLFVAVIVLLVAGTVIALRRSGNSPRPAPVAEADVPPAAGPADYYVSPTAGDGGDGRSPARPWSSIQRAVDAAAPGSTIHLGEGTYLQDVESRRDASSDSPITITGPSTAVVKGTGGPSVIAIAHDHHVLRGFIVDGLQGPPNRSSSYRTKLILIQSGSDAAGVTGVRVTGMSVQNASGECIRLRRGARDNEISETRIASCGVDDFRFDGGGKNGEGLYIGTAPEQLDDDDDHSGGAGGPAPDRSDGNRVHHNTIDTRGNECVDIKEGSSGNVVEHNSCTGQLDPESGGLDARGSGNVFRDNLVFANRGAGIRLGGDDEEDGTGNDVYNNTIRDNRGGGVKIMRTPQGMVCGNVMSDNGGGESVGEYGDSFDPQLPCP
jgi:hypothetical protein